MCYLCTCFDLSVTPILQVTRGLGFSRRGTAFGHAQRQGALNFKRSSEARGQRDTDASNFGLRFLGELSHVAAEFASLGSRSIRVGSIQWGAQVSDCRALTTLLGWPNILCLAPKETMRMAGKKDLICSYERFQFPVPCTSQWSFVRRPAAQSVLFHAEKIKGPARIAKILWKLTPAFLQRCDKSKHRGSLLAFHLQETQVRMGHARWLLLTATWQLFVLYIFF